MESKTCLLYTSEKRIIQVEEKVPAKMLIPLSIQHMFAMFGASVLVPFLFGISPAIVLLMNGVGTLLFIFITKGKAPAYLGSSFEMCIRDRPYYAKLYKTVMTEYRTRKIFPPPEDMFNAFHFTPLHQVKVVILGQDPYCLLYTSRCV